MATEDDMVDRSCLMIGWQMARVQDARKWLASKLAPKKYGLHRAGDRLPNCWRPNRRSRKNGKDLTGQTGWA